ncbi:hypothetical protein [Rhizobium azibense]|uniref:hypothetical protein n=1 Tax=Rhizobium azibense TaxID=1136135 RepID=UPI0010535B04|nr:hypothetical protein [Rhizobium azibense]
MPGIVFNSFTLAYDHLSAVLPPRQNGASKVGPIAPKQAQKKSSARFVNGLREIQQSLMPNTLCGGLDKPDGTCQLPDIFPAMAHKIHGSAREIAQC